MRRSFVRQVAPLIALFAMALWASLFLQGLFDEEPYALDRESVERLPQIPDLSGFPAELANRLADAHQRLGRGSQQVEALGEIAQLYLANGFNASAALCLEGLARVEPEVAQWPYLLALAHGDSADQVEVADLLDRALTLDPGYSVGYLRLGDALSKLSRFDAARMAYEARLERAPNDPWAFLALGRLAFAESKLEEAAGYLEACVERAPLLAEAYELLIEVAYENEQYADAKRWRAAMDSAHFGSAPADPWEEALAGFCCDTARLQAWAERCWIRGEQGKALSLLERASELAPGQEDVLLALVDKLIGADWGEQAYQRFRQEEGGAALSATAYRAVAGLFRRGGFPELSLEVLSLGMRRFPDSLMFSNQLGLELVESGRLADAELLFQRSLEIDPQDVMAAEALGKLRAEP